MANTEHRGQSPPYVPWVTFKSFMQELSTSVIPLVMDGGMYRGKSGSTQSELRVALRFFGLTEGEDNRTTPRLHTLTAASNDPEAFKAELQTLLPESYAPIIEGLDLERGTRVQIEQAFEDKGGLKSTAKTKAIRFFLSAMGEAGIPVSPHFGADRRASPGVRRNGISRPVRNKAKKSMAGDEGVENGNGSGGESSAQNVERLTCSIPGGRTVVVTFPNDLTTREQNFLVTYIQGYFELSREG